MKSVNLFVLRFVKIFFMLFGFMQFLFMLRNVIPPYGLGSGILIHHSTISLIVALIFTITHLVVSSEKLDSKISVKARILICSIPCAVACGCLAFDFGLQGWVFSQDKTTSIMEWTVSFVVSLGGFLLIYFLIEKKYLAAAEKYNKALIAYKKRTEGVQDETGRGETPESL